MSREGETGRLYGRALDDPDGPSFLERSAEDRHQFRLIVAREDGVALGGARISEALRIDWEKDVSLAQRTVILRRTKNGKPRAVHLPDPALIELAAVAPEKRIGKVFQWQKRHSVYGPLRRACKRAGVEYLPPHQQGRHTYATWLRSHAGLDLKGIMEAGGWDNVQSVARYAHVSPGEAARAADRLPVVQKSAHVGTSRC